MKNKKYLLKKQLFYLLNVSEEWVQRLINTPKNQDPNQMVMISSGESSTNNS